MVVVFKKRLTSRTT